MSETKNVRKRKIMSSKDRIRLLIKGLESSSNPAIRTKQKFVSKAEFVKLAKKVKSIFEEEERGRQRSISIA